MIAKFACPLSSSYLSAFLQSLGILSRNILVFFSNLILFLLKVLVYTKKNLPGK